GPDFGGREHPGKGRVLAQATCLFRVATKDLADVAERAFENGQPFAVATDEGGGVRVLAQPTVEIVAGDLQERGLFAEPRGDAPSHLQADFVVDLVLHGSETSRRHELIQEHTHRTPLRHLTPALSPVEAEREKSRRRLFGDGSWVVENFDDTSAQMELNERQFTIGG